MSDLSQYVRDALNIKFRPESVNLSHQVEDASLSARYGKDAFLRAILNSTVGGPVPHDGVMLSEAAVVAAATEEQKNSAITTIRVHFANLLPHLQADVRREAEDLYGRLTTLN